MQQRADRKSCPFCGGEIPLLVSVCDHCKRYLDEEGLHCPKIPSIQIQNSATLYEIVPDGIRFGLAFRGEIKVHGLDLENARELASILNSIADLHETG